jgi:mannan endo-1,4-beta-mannosidase
VIKRIFTVLLALATLVGVVVGARVFLAHRDPRPVTAPRQRTFPNHYVGIVSYNVKKFDKSCDCAPNIAVHYLHIGGSTEMGFARSIIGTGAIPMLELEPYGISLAKIASGGEDGWLTKYAQAVSSLHSPVIMSFAPEANGTWYTWGYKHDPPGAFVRAWRHVVTLFRTAEVRNIKWAWIMNVQFASSENIKLLWPGAAFVNILGLDGYFIDPTTFESFFGASIVAMRALSADPLLITETAAAPSVGKANALNMITSGVTQYGLAGFIWFDVRQRGSRTRQNWSLEDEPAALHLFSNAVRRSASEQEARTFDPSGG